MNAIPRNEKKSATQTKARGVERANEEEEMGAGVRNYEENCVCTDVRLGEPER